MITPLFNQITFNNPIKVNNSNSFVKYSAVQFRGNLEEDTFELSKKSDYNEKDFDNIKNAVKKDNFVGSGFEGRVFSMKNPKYVVKIPKDYFNGKKLNNDLVKTDLIEEEVTEQDRVNHIVKKYKNGIIIMNKVAGKQIQTKKEMNEVADLPASAYQNLLNQIIDAEKKGMEFDFAMNNVLYDNKTGSLTAIDFRPFKEGKRKFNPLEKMYFVFDCFRQPYEKKVSGKIITAALDNIKPDADPKRTKLDYDFNTIIKLLQHNYPNNWGILEVMKSNLDNIKYNRFFADSKYELSLLDKDIDFVKNSVNKFLIINESEQA